MKSDAQLKNDVTRELAWDPAVNPANVGVAVKNGVVTLTGHLETYSEKRAIERAVQRVQGVQALAVELDVRLAPAHKRSDSEIAEAVEAALRWHSEVPNEHLQVRVEKGWVTLKGEVDWDYQRRAAERAVRPLVGVVGVSNDIGLMVRATPADVGSRIREALERHARDESKRIEVSVQGTRVVLRGHVHSWAERAAAQGAAWAAPGITSVENHIAIAP